MKHTTGYQLGRRDLLQSLGLVGAAAATFSPGAAVAVASSGHHNPLAIPANLDTSDPEHNLIAYMKILSDLGDRPTYRFHTGRILSVLPRQVGEPLMDFVACKQDRVRRLTDGSYQHGYRGVILFTELDTGRVLDTFRNPFTGKTTDVQHFKTSWGSGIYTKRGAFSLATAARSHNAPGLEDTPFRMNWSIVDDDVWVTYDERIVTHDDTGNVLYADSSMYRYYTSLSQLKDPERSSADTVMSWDTETTWWPWMQMDDRPGHLLFGSMGKKYGDLNDVPANVVAESETRFPGQLSHPIDWADYTLHDPGLAP